MTHLVALALAGLLLVGCTAPGSDGSDDLLAAADGLAAVDGGPSLDDAATVDDLIPAGPDLASVLDSTPPTMDLSLPPTMDLSLPPTLDLSLLPAMDLSLPPTLDLSPLADLATGDLATAQDLVTPPDLRSFCGNGAIEGAEQCDDGQANDDVAGLCGASCARLVLWTRTHDGPASGADRGQGIASDGVGNVLVTGFETVAGQQANVWVRKYDAAGAVIWTRTHNGAASGGDAGQGITTDGAGNAIVTGHEAVAGQVDNVWTRKFDPAGSALWTWTYGGTSNGEDRGNGVATDGTGNVLVVGHVGVFGPSWNIFAWKLDPTTGVEAWNRGYNSGANTNDRGHAVATDGAGNVVITGSVQVPGPASEIWIRKYNPSGSELWTRTSAGSMYQRGNGIATDGSGNVLVTGDEGTAAWVRKYDAAGNVLWTRTFNGPSPNGFDYGHGIATDGAGNVIVAGSEEIAPFHDGVWVRKYDPAGNVVWTRKYDNGRNAGALAVATDKDGNVLVAGYEEILGQGYNVWVRKYLP